MAEILQRFDYIRRFYQEMKRLITAILLLCLAAQAASAQWYLFPGSPSRRDTSASMPVVIDSTAVIGLAVVPGEDETDSISACDSAEVVDNSIVTTLIIPINSTTNPSSNFLDFYSGALLAASDLAAKGIDIRLKVIDSMMELPDPEVISTSEVVIGPVEVDKLMTVSRMCRDGACVISPLEPKAAALVGQYDVIQAPSGWESQIDELVAWLASETSKYDSIVLLQNSMEEGGESAPYLVSRLNDFGISYSISSDVENAPMSRAGSTSFVLVSENSAFCADCVRDIALKAVQGERVALYSTSKLRSISEIEPASLHTAGARITATYYADPMDSAVLKFRNEYLKMFHAEPSSFAYQGHDLVSYFVTVCSMYRSGWQLYLTDHPWQGLQTDFRFVDSQMAGRLNTAVRRIRYRENNVITVEKK